MTIRNASTLRKVLIADTATSTLSALSLVVASGLVASLTGLSQTLLFWIGVGLVPWAAFLAYVTSREELSRMILFDVVLVNSLWVAASIVLLFSGLIAPNLFGTVFIVAQAALVAVFALLQAQGLRAAEQQAA
ncbi:MAG: hypothetical protein JJ969_06185 [Rhizobiaceae bacterium]|nr:hypothetical protein [Rhizobiaceae bacterium]MBO6725718.1 hypothetical protein [Rhizobiaceae bacterium]